MPKIKRSWDLLSEQKRRDVVEEIINYFQTERNEEIGVIAAESLLDFFLQTVSHDIYNKGVEDLRTFIKERAAGLETEIDALVKK